MKRLRQILFTNKDLIRLNLIVVIAFGVFGFFFHDFLLWLDRGSDEEMTVFPFGTLCIFLGVILFTCFFSYQKGMSVFNLNVSMGQTRRSYIAEQFIVRLGLFLADYVLSFTMNKLEGLKFEMFYYPEYSLELSFDFLFGFKALFMIILGLLSFSMFVLAFSLKLGMKANIIAIGAYMVFVVTMAKFDVILSYFGEVNIELTSYLNMLYVVFAAVFTAGIVVSVLMLRRQQVN